MVSVLDAIGRFVRPAASPAPAAPPPPVAPDRFSTVDPAREAEVQALLGAYRAADATSILHDPRLPLVDGKATLVHPDGFFVRGPNAVAMTYDAQGAQTLYRSARGLAQAPLAALAKLPPGVRGRLVDHMEEALRRGTRAGPESVTDRKLRSGAMTALLSVAGSSDGALRQRALDVLVRHAEVEPDARFRRLLVLNLEQLAPGSAPDRLKKVAPPYDELFPPGWKGPLEVAHYAHHESWVHVRPRPEEQYVRAGFRIVAHTPKNERGEETWILEGVLKTTPMRVRLVKSNELLFRDAGDAKTPVVIYTGHSHVGGNVTASLRASADASGVKVMVFALCNGGQTLFKVVNRHPEIDFITSRDLSYFSHNFVLALALLHGIADRKKYRDIRDGVQFGAHERPDNFMLPEELIYGAHTDLNGNGAPDVVGGAVERTFNVVEDHAAGGKTDLVARATDVEPDALDGSKVMDAVQFARTIAHTHQHYQGHFRGSPIRGFDLHAWRSGGWFAGKPDDPAVRVTDEQGADGKLRKVLQVNRCFKDQSDYALGALVTYEMVRHYVGAARFGADAKAQGIILAGELIYELYGSREEARAIFKALGARAGVPGLDADFVLDAVEAEEHGMGSATQIAKLKARYGIG